MHLSLHVRDFWICTGILLAFTVDNLGIIRNCYTCGLVIEYVVLGLSSSMALWFSSSPVLWFFESLWLSGSQASQFFGTQAHCRSGSLPMTMALVVNFMVA